MCGFGREEKWGKCRTAQASGHGHARGGNRRRGGGPSNWTAGKLRRQRWQRDPSDCWRHVHKVPRQMHVEPTEGNEASHQQSLSRRLRAGSSSLPRGTVACWCTASAVSEAPSTNLGCVDCNGLGPKHGRTRKGKMRTHLKILPRARKRRALTCP